MKKSILTLILVFSFFMMGFKSKENANERRSNFSVCTISNKASGFTIMDKEINDFFVKYSKFKEYHSDVLSLYKSNKNIAIWHDDKDLIELGHLLYSKVNNMKQETGIQPNIPYKSEIDQVFKNTSAETISKAESDLFVTCMYIYYDNKVYIGLDEKKVQKIGWYLPKKNISYVKILDSLLLKPSLLKENNVAQFSQYYKLKEYLKKYKDIQSSNQWKRIEIDTTVYKEYNPNENSTVIAQIRHQLFVLGDLKTDSKESVYNQDLMDGVIRFKRRHGLKENYTIEPGHIGMMNNSIENIIHVIMVNMERCRWIPPQLEKQNKYIMVNIPSFRLFFVKNGVNELISNVFLGSEMNKTVIFSGNMNKVVFSPYWTVPRSIVANELEFKASQDPNYLKKLNIVKTKEGQYRQLPGPGNSLGLVKFLLPNPNDIYIHDTPNKEVFNYEIRDYSHGCINIQKAKELAYTVLEDDPNWTHQKIDNAMNGGKETPYNLKQQIPVYIGYFTAWVNDENEISFFRDIYSRDERLYKLVYGNNEGL